MGGDAGAHASVFAGEAAHAHAWVPIREAAMMLGVSPDTIKRRIKGGEIPARKEPRPQGYVWLVQLESTPALAPVAPLHAWLPAPAPAPTLDAASDAVALAVARAQVEELRALVRTRSEELDARRRETQELLVLLQRSQVEQASPQQQEGNACLARQAGTMGPAQEASPHPPVDLPMQTPMRLPWWRRVLHALAEGA